MPLIASTGRENQRWAGCPFIPVGDVYGLAVLDSWDTFGPVLPRETRVFDHESGKSRAKSSRVVASSLNSAFLDFMLHGSLMLSPSFQTLEVLVKTTVCRQNPQQTPGSTLSATGLTLPH